MLRKISTILMIVCLLVCACSSKKVNLVSLIVEMSNRENNAYFPDPYYKLIQFSSYNRESVSPDKEGWFANDDMSHFIRVEYNQGRREFVLFDTTGPGAIVRWWMTFYMAQNGIIRVYLDNDTIPQIQGLPDKLLSGTLLAEPPFAVSVHKGVPVQVKGRDMDHNLYLPIPFAIHCKITYECDSLVKLKPGYYSPDVFYNIGYRAYKHGTKVETFSMNDLKKAKPVLDKTKTLLLNPQISSVSAKEFRKELNPGDSFSIEYDKKESAVNQLILEVNARDSLQALRSTVFSASFDGTQTIWVPVGDFFGTGYKIYPHRTWMNNASREGKMESDWIMPFQQRCRLTFTNYGAENITIKGSAELIHYKWNSNSMYFGSCWHEYYKISTRDQQGNYFDLNFATIKGKGVYVGDEICLFNTSYEWWGEGDEKIFVDGESFPSIFGTGTEDYYGYAFGRPQAFSHPFISQPVGDGNEGNTNNGGLTINMRHRSLDAIPFNSSISPNIELWHWAKTKINYAITSYWYVQFPFELNIKPDISSVQHSVARSTQDVNKSQMNVE